MTFVKNNIQLLWSNLYVYELKALFIYHICDNNNRIYYTQQREFIIFDLILYSKNWLWMSVIIIFTKRTYKLVQIKLINSQTQLKHFSIWLMKICSNEKLIDKIYSSSYEMSSLRKIYSCVYHMKRVLGECKKGHAHKQILKIY